MQEPTLTPFDHRPAVDQAGTEALPLQTNGGFHNRRGSGQSADALEIGFQFLGDAGTIEGTIGLLYDYPAGRVDTLRYQPNREPREWHAGADNLGTLRTVLASYRSAAEGRAIAFSEFDESP